MAALYDSKTKTMDDYGLRKYLLEEEKYKVWIELEVALAIVQGELGIIPLEMALEIESKAKYEDLDLEYIENVYKEIGHGFVPFIKGMTKMCGQPCGGYIHYGITTQNIQQSGQLLIAKRMNETFKRVYHDILTHLSKLASEHADSTMAGRTHGKHAIPITYGYKVSVWIYELIDAIDRIIQSEDRVFRLMMGGAVGSFNSMPIFGLKVQREVAKRVGLKEMLVPSRNISTHKIEYIMNLSLLANVCHKIAEEVFATSIEEFNEVKEGFTHGTIGSSTMPHKINPKLSKGIIANAQKLYSLASTGLYSSARPFEGDSSSYMLLDGLFKEALELFTEVVLRTQELTKYLYVNKEHLLKNAKINHGLDNSEYVMMKIAKKVGKDKAHAIIYELAMEQIRTQLPYIDVLKKHNLLSQYFTIAELEKMLDPRSYIGLSKELAIKMSQKALDYAMTLNSQKKIT